MTMYKEYRVGGGHGPVSFLGPLLILALVFGGLFFLAQGLFWVLSWAAPVLLLLTLVMDYKVVVNYFKYIWKMLKENIAMGLLLLVVTIFGYPFVAGYLFFKAYAKRSLNKSTAHQSSKSDVFVEFEEVEDDDSFLELPEFNRQKEKPQAPRPTSYDDVF